MEKKFLVGILLLALATMSCQRKPESMGSDTGVTIVADSTLYSTIQPAIEAALQQEIYTPQPEYLLKVSYLPPEELNKVVVRPNIVLAGILGAEDKISKQIHTMLPASAIEQVERGESFVFRKEDPWAKKQLLLVLVANDDISLMEQIATNSDYLFGVIRDRIISQTKTEMYSQYEQKSISDELLEKYGWALRIQHDYNLWKDEADDQFVMLRRTSPERWLFVYWEDVSNPDSVNAEWAISRRNKIGLLHYERDQIAEQYLSIKETDFAGRRATQLQGLWENDVKVAGGPFKAFAFYDEDTQRGYLVDVSAFAPGQEKESLVRQLEIMARTFYTAADEQRANGS